MKVLAGERGGLGFFSLAFLVLACMMAFFSGDMLLVLAVLSAMAGLLVLGRGAGAELAPRSTSPSGRWTAAARLGSRRRARALSAGQRRVFSPGADSQAPVIQVLR
jgi:hypothetical protein